jgi:1,2-phenylacetyl-CoA epoxidase catalytic subunit
MTDFLNVEHLDSEQQAALERFLLSLADSKRLMGIRYSDWTIGAPSIEAGISVSSMAQDEWGHARLLYSMFKGLGKDPVPLEHDRSAAEYASVGELDEEMPDWAAVIAAMVLVDGALTAMLGSFSEGTFEPAQQRVPKMLSEEEFHASLGVAWFKRLAAAEGEACDLLRAAVEKMLPGLLAWTGADDAPMKALQGLGVIGAPDDRLAAFRTAVADLTGLVGVDVASVAPSTEWDAERGRTSGQPAEEAVERARGDKNRALFVE